MIELNHLSKKLKIEPRSICVCAPFMSKLNSMTLDVKIKITRALIFFFFNIVLFQINLHWIFPFLLQNVGILCRFIHDKHLAQLYTLCCYIWCSGIGLYCAFWTFGWTVGGQILICKGRLRNKLLMGREMNCLCIMFTSLYFMDRFSAFGW